MLASGLILGVAYLERQKFGVPVVDNVGGQKRAKRHLKIVDLGRERGPPDGQFVNGMVIDKIDRVMTAGSSEKTPYFLAAVDAVAETIHWSQTILVHMMLRQRQVRLFAIQFLPVRQSPLGLLDLRRMCVPIDLEYHQHVLIHI